MMILQTSYPPSVCGVRIFNLLGREVVVVQFVCGAVASHTKHPQFESRFAVNLFLQHFSG